jgi:DNA repair protein RadC
MKNNKKQIFSVTPDVDGEQNAPEIASLVNLDTKVSSIKKVSIDEPHYLGHRNRMKEKFLLSEEDNFSDYELLELLLFYAIPRKDVKPLAKLLLKTFGNFYGLINSPMEHLEEIEGVTKNVYLILQISKHVVMRSLKENILKQSVISSWSALLDYLKIGLGGLRVEQFRVLFLNKKNILIADEVMAVGTIDQTPVYPREIVKRCLFHEAGAIILVHNHPTGNTKPSNADIDNTQNIINACKTINVSVHDHVIIGGNNYFSFKSNMLL